MKGQRRGWGKLRVLPSGRYQASYVGPDGVRYTAPPTFYTKQDAKGWLSRESRLVALDVWTSPAEREGAGKAKTITVGEFAEQWLAERDVAPKTRAL